MIALCVFINHTHTHTQDSDKTRYLLPVTACRCANNIMPFWSYFTHYKVKVQWMKL